ncbi:MAG: peptidylprolyl isomerase [Planctomycetes bacterium]|nr:peptidylprolyl isomerase [Planctomycetota bacterium]MCL4730871.1 peptidylprolyl isomerase [Planctomycetota bacterium]
MADLRAHIADLEKRPERKVDTIEVQHLLVAHKDAGIGGVTRSLAEAEKLTGQLLDEILKGANFDALVKKHTNDQHPGIYGMTMKGGGDRARNIYPRSGMVAAFGDVGWRLDVNEIGVAPYHPQKSPYGFHIIKRTK